MSMSTVLQLSCDSVVTSLAEDLTDSCTSLFFGRFAVWGLFVSTNLRSLSELKHRSQSSVQAENWIVVALTMQNDSKCILRKLDNYVLIGLYVCVSIVECGVCVCVRV